MSLEDQISHLNNSILDGIAKIIIKNDSVEELKDLFVETDYFRQSALKWLDRDLQLNLFQLSVLHNRPRIVEHLGTFCPNFLQEKTIYKLPDHLCEYQSDIFINLPLHIAAYVGSLEILIYIINKSASFSMEDVGLMAIEYNTVEHSFRKCKFTTTSMEKILCKVFDVCILKKHIHCISHIIDTFILANNTFSYVYASSSTDHMLLRKACCLGCGPLVEVLLERCSISDINRADSMGKTVLHVALWNGDCETICHLLSKGADPNIGIQSRSNLHLLYTFTMKMHNLSKVTLLLVKSGVNVNHQDSTSSTPLHVLVKQLRGRFLDISDLNKLSNFTIKPCDNVPLEKDNVDEELVKCIQLLLSNGADPSIKNGDNESVVDVFHSDMICKPLISRVLKPLELILEMTDDPQTNTADKRTEQLVLIMERNLRVPSLENVVGLYCQHGADVDMKLMERASMFTMYPVVFAIKWRAPIEIVQLLFNYMSHNQFHDALHYDVPLNVYFGHDQTYKQNLTQLITDIKIRSLKHMCKISILLCLKRYSKKCSSLDLPNPLKDYLLSTIF